MATPDQEAMIYVIETRSWKHAPFLLAALLWPYGDGVTINWLDALECSEQDVLGSLEDYYQRVMDRLLDTMKIARTEISDGAAVHFRAWQATESASEWKHQKAIETWARYRP